MKLTKGMSAISLLVTLAILGILMFAFQQWTHHQRKSAVRIYQIFQAIQIAENQKQRQFLNLGCKSQITQNNIQFKINCLEHKVNVSYPQGKISL
ncbi:DUF5374 domain-containing protein [Pasteurella bettyae]|uniref:Prepilin peptidase dependent protein C n=1 Tax=Pasteurella bettyae CCUG 2042 TaxID=1095749 RepID=I3DFP4_9PAST|nr:DUF5374 domain-containing protein [Pasteurella bettyae]EIJ70537.1 hypothetical protein HMPREF1052_2131 [Pasteurella bettyae CCUG 2042]SUB20963.1 membrane protein [Pasteurella bettyae]